MESRPHARPAGLTTQAEVARDLRAARAAALARRDGGAARSDAGIDHLVCACGGERFGLPMAAVAQVLPMRPCTPVPGAVPALVGLAALSGRIVGVLSLARALGRPDAASEPDRASGHLVVLRSGQSPARPLALAVDRVLGIARVAGPVAAPQDGADRDGLGNAAASGYAPGAAEHGRPDFVVIDLPRLLHRVLP